jgi:hypothetical protein
MVNGESTPAIGNKVRNLRPRGIVKQQTANVKGSINFEPRALSVILKRQSAIRSEPLGLTNRKTGNGPGSAGMKCRLTRGPLIRDSLIVKRQTANVKGFPIFGIPLLRPCIAGWPAIRLQLKN